MILIGEMNMKNECFDCGRAMERRTRYTVDDPYVGRITVKGEYWHCPECGEDEVPYATLKAVEDERRRIVDDLLWKSLTGTEEFDRDFMLTHELAEPSPITPQSHATPRSHITPRGKVVALSHCTLLQALLLPPPPLGDVSSLTRY